jgi:hypothetical protein
MTHLPEARVGPRYLKGRDNTFASLADEEARQGRPWKRPLVVTVGLLRELTPHRMVTNFPRAPVTREMKLCEQHDIGVIRAVNQAVGTELVKSREMRKFPHRSLLGWQT